MLRNQATELADAPLAPTTASARVCERLAFATAVRTEFALRKRRDGSYSFDDQLARLLVSLSGEAGRAVTRPGRGGTLTWRFSADSVRDFNLINNTDSLYSFVIPVQYPKAGESNSAARIGIVPTAGGATRWMASMAAARQGVQVWAPV